MADNKNYIEGSIYLSVEVSHADGEFSAYIGDNIGGSGIEVKGSSPKEVSDKVAQYIEDYFYEN